VHCVDLAYLRTHPQHLPAFLHHQRIRETPVAGGSICAASRLTLDDGSSVFAKTWPSGEPPEGFFAAEAGGLRWLAEAGAPVPEVIAELPAMLVLQWVEPGEPTPAGAHELGRALARLHRAGAPRFGAEWPGYIGALPLSNTPSDGPWARWFAEARLRPYLRISANRGALPAADVTQVERLLSDIEGYADGAAAEPPARIHGDLWPGNVLWSSTNTGCLVDPAAQGGHRETDLANLALWGGVPYFDRLLAGYQEVWPLADGWPARVPLHQLHLLLVHTALFGASYRTAVMSAVRATVDQ
jgi:fructosamine-3-kinase